MIGIIQYGLGNIKAFANVYKMINMPYKFVTCADDFSDVTKLILPGVGCFDYAMECLNSSGMREMLDEKVLEQTMPVLGVCVGMQMFAKSSEEGVLPGLGWIDGVVKKLRSDKINGAPLPHMGWNSLDIVKPCRLMRNLGDNPRFYFLHSYYYECDHQEDVVATATYGDTFSCVINHGNVYGIQCHPEKSHSNGTTLLKNFGEL